MPMLPKKALIAVTGYSDVFYDDGAKTGLFYSEALHPYEVFKKAGFDVVVASENGKVGIDDHSKSPDFLNATELSVLQDPNSEFNLVLKNIKKASELDPKEFGLFYASGGHGTVFDFENARGLQSIAEDIYARGGPVSAVCHGPMILHGVRDRETGKPLVQGRNVTGFPDKGEDIMKLTEMLKSRKLGFVAESVRAVGAKWNEPSQPFGDFSVVDGRIITGANPASATSTARKALDVFESASKL
jgi:putative intracellular protease/amidase